MLPKYHFLFGFVFALILYLVFHPNFFSLAIIFLSSILIDVDHYLYYIFNKKSLSLRKTYKFFTESEIKWFDMPIKEREKYKRITFYFHGIEFFLPLFLLALLSNLFFWIFLGCFFHLFIDLIEFSFYNEPFYSKTSQIYVYITNKKKKKFN